MEIYNYADPLKEQLLHAKELLGTISEKCDAFEAAGAWNTSILQANHLKDILRADIASFIMYLSISDGSISQDEVTAYKFITDFVSDDAASMMEYIKKNNILSVKYETEAPYSMQKLYEAEMKYIEIGGKEYRSVVKDTALLFEMVGSIVIYMDSDVTRSEKSNFDIIMGTIKSYANQHGLAK